MTDNTSLVNLALQSYGDRTTITAAQLAAGGNNQAKQANLTFTNTRDSLLRMAPWDCAMKTANLTYITSIPGTPENTSAATNLWQRGQPRPPWAYEYQYPVDCLRACWIIPAQQTGYAGGVPIITAVTGGAPTTWLGEPIRFKVGIDKFLTVITAQIVNAGVDYVVGEIITLPSTPSVGSINAGDGVFFPTGQPQGAPPQIRVLTVSGTGAILTCEMVGQLPDATTPASGSLFFGYTNPVTQDYTDRSGSGATFNLTYFSTSNTTFALSDQRVIFTNQEFATLCYVRQVLDPNVWDPLFQDAFVHALGGDLCMAITGDKALAKMCYAYTNQCIEEARKADGNEGLTVNNVTPDWIRARGISWSDGLNNGPYSSFDWGQFGLYGF